MDFVDDLLPHLDGTEMLVEKRQIDGLAYPLAGNSKVG
jgi:hypothetical protein